MGERQTLRVWVDSCQNLPRRPRRRNRLAIKVFEIPPATATPILAGLSLPVSGIFGSGSQDSTGLLTFPGHLHQRFTEVPVRSGWRLRFEIHNETALGSALLRPNAIGFAEIEVEDLMRRDKWRLLLSDPVSHEAVYGGDRIFKIRQPSFLCVRTKICSAEAPDSLRVDSSDMSPSICADSSPSICAERVRADSSPQSGVTAQSDPKQSSFSAGPTRPARQRLSTSGSRRMGRIKVLIITRGTRGDVQPFVALARGLAAPPYNCDVLICTEIIWKKFIKSARKGLLEGSLSFRPCGGNTMRKMEGAAAQWVLRNGQSYDTLQALMFSRSEVEFFTSEGCFFHWAEEERPDFLVFGLTCTHVAMIISEALNIPIVAFLLQPTSEIQARSTPLSATDTAFDPLRKMVSGPQFNAVIKQIMEHVGSSITLNELRQSRGLLPAPRDIRDYSVHYRILADQKVPMLTPINPLVRGSRASYLPGLTFTDFIFLRMGGADRLDDEVSDFISKAKGSGRQLVAITFSSMPIGEKKVLKLAVSICTRCLPPADDELDRKRPAVIALAGGQAHDPAPAELLSEVEKLSLEGRLLVLRRGVPFGTLFPLLDAMVLHGGLGVTSEAFYAGIPIVTCGILVMDQRYWAARCEELGCGCEGVPIDQAIAPSDPSDPSSLPRIAELMNKALDKRSCPGGIPTWTEKAREVQKQLLPSPENDDGGVRTNANEVFRCGMEEPRVVSQAYADEQGCVCAFFRQQKCCCICWLNCVRWCFCAQIPRLIICFFMCLSWFLWYLPRRCFQRAFCPRRQAPEIDVMTPKGVDGLSQILFFARERIETRSMYFDDRIDAIPSRIDAKSLYLDGSVSLSLDETCSIGEEAHALEPIPTSEIHVYLPP